MGVTVLQQYPMTENKTGPQTIEFLTKRVVALGAAQTGQFLVDCETYVSVPQLGECYQNFEIEFSSCYVPGWHRSTFP
ncbi:Mediator of RNA polymerase II transcription subunit 20 [Anthophora plagiata]